MSNIALLAVLLVLLTCAPPVSAQHSLIPLSQSQIRSDMFGRMFTGEYSNGGRWAERLNPNMTSIYVEDGKSIHGHMEFRGALLCFEYPHRPDLDGGCFEVWKRGNNCFDFYSTRSNANLEQRRWGKAWIARAWDADQPSTCKSDLIG